MASLLNNASLLLNPAGSTIAYKEDKIYSVIPNNGDGDFTFSGGDGGTRVNQDGYVEVTPHNLQGYSENVVTYWTKQLVTATANTIKGPFGRLATSVVETATTGAHRIYNSNTFTGNKTTFTMYLKKYPTNSSDHRIWIEIWNSTQSIMNQTKFDLDTGAVTQNTGTAYAKYMGDGWWELNCFTTVEVLYTTNYLIFSGNDATRDPAGSTSEGFYFAGAQVTAGHIVRPYQPTTNRLDYPRITYQNGRGALLSEPQRTNVATNSQTISAGTGTTVSLDSGISPDGTQNADKLIEDTSTGTHITTFGGSLGGSVDSSIFCVSIFAKAAERTRFIIFDNNQGAGAAINVFDLGNGIKISGNGTIENYGNGWYRCIIFPSKTDNTTANIQIRLINTGTNDSYTGDGSSGIFFWGKQIEAGSFPTSYIPTTSATVTRPQDRSSKSMPSIVNTSAGTLYLDVVIKGTLSADQFYWGLYDGSGNTIYIGLYNIYGLFRIQNSYALDVNFNPVFELNKRYKFALAYQTNDAVAYMNGNSVGSDTSVSIPSVTTMGINFLNENANIESYTLAYFDSRLSNAQLAELTTVRSGSGGNISYYGPYTIHTFTGSATFTPSFNGEVEVLVVAGGGSGGVGSNGGGGGGAGGLLYASSYGVSQGTGVTVTVGAGGGSRIGRGSGNNGSNSVFGGLTATGGGGGGGATGGPAYGKDGGSGGGAQYSSYGGNGIPGQGNNGGDGNYYLGGNHDAGGGGGGAGFAGLDATLSNAGNGGDGLAYSISGFSTYYAGGGGGSSNNASAPQPLYPGEGGLGGGGKGGIQGTTLLGTDGVDGLGAGGGAGVGSSGGNSGAGGDGIVIVRYLT